MTPHPAHLFRLPRRRSVAVHEGPVRHDYDKLEASLVDIKRQVGRAAEGGAGRHQPLGRRTNSWCRPARRPA